MTVWWQLRWGARALEHCRALLTSVLKPASPKEQTKPKQQANPKENYCS